MSGATRYTITEDTCGGFIVRDDFAEQQIYVDGHVALNELYETIADAWWQRSKDE